MKMSLLKWCLLAAGLLMTIAALLPAGAPTGHAAPLASISETPTEPPTLTPTAVPTNTPTPTPVPPSPTPVPPSPTPIPPSPTQPSAPPPEPGVADPSIVKTTNRNDVQVGDTVEFTLLVTNQGNIPAENVVLSDPLPESLDVIEATTTRGDLRIEGRTITVALGSVAPGEQIFIRVRAQVNAQAQPPQIVNTARITTTSQTNDPNNDVSTVVLRLGQLVGETPAAPGQQVTPVAAPGGPTATPVVVPRALPRTAGEANIMPSLLLLLGLLAIGASLLIRRHTQR